MAKKWMGSKPECQLCGDTELTKFVDGKTTFGPWAMMCEPCHQSNGVGLGQGRGQLYELQPDGTWLKVGG